MIADESASNYNYQMEATVSQKGWTERERPVCFPVFLIGIVLLILKKNQFHRTRTACSRSLFGIADTIVSHVRRDEYSARIGKALG
tara:strand:- start:102 stop:359 length:258 start_codon:yes stop_codon:yes gene_type:complete